ncbi:hypothetical protein ACJ73_04015 [Blastomyces percursus]|uniref:DNA replication regulator SLD2 n=1 Tax=Blastomyces percursus TaxID=1658174 RepID=A0A1J9R9G8_9EURO|nr:hypothetical protein ACJ73_04015 [Blastomyces percursus]
MSDDRIPQNTLTESKEQQPSSTLRAELKEWERSFAAANGGRKPGRDDIKNNTAISAKYKLYSRLRAQSSQTSTHSPVPAEEISQPRKRKRPSEPQEDVNGPPPTQFCSTPRKTPKHIPATPSRGALLTSTTPPLANPHPSQLDPYDSPSTLRRLFSPSYHNNPQEYRHSSSSPLPLRAAIGPTPQRDGKALGLFDLLSASGGSHRSRNSATATKTTTPSSRQGRGSNSHRGDHDGMQTPSRLKGGRTNAGNGDDKDGEKYYENFFASPRTPVSSAKKFYLANFFTTPPGYRYSTVVDGRISSHDDDSNQQTGNDDTVNERRGSASNNPLGSDTPSFLRRRNLFSSSSRANSHQHARGASGATLHDLSPIAVRMPQKLVGKGLSTIVQTLRDIQEERLDEELDVLREIEAEAAVREDDVIINDSQVPLHDVEGDGNREGNTFMARQWKKKGQKRTTRRVIMRPVRAKAKATPEWPVAVIDDDDDGDGNGGSEDELAAMSETQPQAQLQPSAENGANKENEDEYEIARGRRGGLFSASDKDNYADNNDSELNNGDPHSDLDSDSNYEDVITGPASPSHAKGWVDMKKQKFVLTSTANANIKANAAKRKQATTATAATQKLKAKTDAHANYRALKIRGKGSHARGGGRRFGRKRR